MRSDGQLTAVESHSSANQRIQALCFDTLPFLVESVAFRTKHLRTASGEGRVARAIVPVHNAARTAIYPSSKMPTLECLLS